MAFDVEVLRKFKELREQKTDMKAELRDIEEKLTALEDQITNMFADAGVNSIKVDGKRITTSSQIWAKVTPGMKEEAMEALRNLELDHLITLNHQSLSAHIREVLASGKELPDEFKGIIGYHDKIRLSLTG